MTTEQDLHFSLLDREILRYRNVHGETVTANLPQLLVALGADQVRDFPALRPHQRHPWHAFLVQLAAIAILQNRESRTVHHRT
jgi:CRISPR system Cascade subunit CasA